MSEVITVMSRLQQEITRKTLQRMLWNMVSPPLALAEPAAEELATDGLLKKAERFLESLQPSSSGSLQGSCAGMQSERFFCKRCQQATRQACWRLKWTHLIDATTIGTKLLAASTCFITLKTAFWLWAYCLANRSVITSVVVLIWAK